MNRYGLPAVWLLGMALAAAASADAVYRQVDEQGRVTFSDRPLSGAERVEVPPINTTPAVESAPDPLGPVEPQEFAGYQVLSIIAPQRIVPNGLAEQVVEVALEPALQPGHRLEVWLDGKPVAISDELRIPIGQLPRGTHQVEVRILDGRALLESASQEIFVYWPGGNRSGARLRPAPRPLPGVP